MKYVWDLWIITQFIFVNPIWEQLPDGKVHGVNMGPTWVLSAPDGPHVGPMNLAFREAKRQFIIWASEDTCKHPPLNGQKCMAMCPKLFGWDPISVISYHHWKLNYETDFQYMLHINYSCGYSFATNLYGGYICEVLDTFAFCDWCFNWHTIENSNIQHAIR